MTNEVLPPSSQIPTQSSAGYAGDVSVTDAWAMLERDRRALLVDVRSKAEWSFVGIVDLGGLGKDPILVEWQSFPTMMANRDFVSDVEKALAERGVDKSAPLLCLCRSGARSRAAAIALTAAGHAACYNIAEGFEGALDQERHRGGRGGWKAAGLPWVQS